MATWVLPIYAFDETSRLRMRLVTKQLGRDPHVASFSLDPSPDSPTKFTLRVTMLDGEDRPFKNDIRYLDRYLRQIIGPRPGQPPKKRKAPMTRWERLRANIEPDDGV